MTQKRPRHIAIIMDGNGRWATQQGLPRVLGHRAGVEAVRRMVEVCTEQGIEALTLYAFSCENWERPSDEIHDLMRLLDEFIEVELPMLQKNRIRLRAIGRLEMLPASTLTHLKQAIAQTSRNNGLNLILALSYGARQEIIDACRRIAQSVRDGKLTSEQIDEETIASHLYTAGLPDPDLLIRTSGEQRLSNFLLWQMSYTELYLTHKLWPDFSKADFMEALAEYDRRDRRFGKTQAQGLHSQAPAIPATDNGHRSARAGADRT